MPSDQQLHALRFEETDLSSSPNELTLEADANESYQVMDVGVDGANDDTISSITIGEESMIAFPSDDGDDNLFREDSLQDFGYSLYGFMRAEGLPAPMLQVPEGDTLVLSNDTNTGTATIKYMEGGPNMVSPGQPGGPDTKRRTYPVTGTGNSSGVGAGTQTTISVNTSRQPGQFDDFPFGTDVPSNREFDLLALMFNLEDSTGSSPSIDDFRLTTEEQRFLAKDANFVEADNAEYPAKDPDDGPLIFSMDPVQTYTPGDELDIEVRATQGTGSGSGNVRVNCTAIFDRRPV